MNKKFSLFLILLSCMFFFIVTVLGRESFSSDYSNSITDKQLVVVMYEPLGTYEDWPIVLEKINQIVKQKLGFTLEVIFTNPNRTVSTLDFRISSNEQVDLIIAQGNYGDYFKGYLEPLDDLLFAYGSDIQTYIDEEELSYMRINGVLYEIPVYSDHATSYGICMRKDMLTECGIDISAIHSFSDFEAVLEKIAQNYPDVYGIAPAELSGFDPLGDGFGVLMDHTQPLTVVNYYETEEFEQYIRWLSDLKEKGYLSPGGRYSYFGNHRNFLYQLFYEDKLFSYILRYKPGIANQESQITGIEMEVIELTQPVMTSESLSRVAWGIYTGSEYKAEAMQLLNLLYTDRELNTLFCWGIENVHYIIEEEPFIRYPDGIDISNTPYYFGKNWQMPNPYCTYIWNGETENIAENITAYNQSAVRSPALGFYMDRKNVEYEYSKVQQVIDVYIPAFLSGELNIDVSLPQFLSELHSAGIDRIIEEKQRQLDLWLERRYN